MWKLFLSRIISSLWRECHLSTRWYFPSERERHRLHSDLCFRLIRIWVKTQGSSGKDPIFVWAICLSLWSGLVLRWLVEEVFESDWFSSWCSQQKRCCFECRIPLSCFRKVLLWWKLKTKFLLNFFHSVLDFLWFR